MDTFPQTIRLRHQPLAMASPLFRRRRHALFGIVLDMLGGGGIDTDRRPKVSGGCATPPQSALGGDFNRCARSTRLEGCVALGAAQ